MFEAYKIAIDVSVTDRMSAPLTSMAALMARAESKTGSLQERLQKVSAVLKSGAGLLDAGANLANSFGKAIDQAAALKEQLAGIGSASGDAAGAMDGMQHSAARVLAPKRKADLGKLVAGGGTDLAAALGLPAQEPAPKARKRAPAVRKTAAAGTTRPRAKPKAKEAAALDQLGAYGQVEKVAAKTTRRKPATRRAAATHKGRGKEDAGAQVLHQLMNLGGPNSAAALIRGARGQVDALVNQQMQAARASVNGALDQIGHSLSSGAQKMLDAGIRQASDFVSQHQQAFQHVAEGIVIVQRAMEFTDQVRAVASTFQDVRSAFGALGGPAMQPVHATLERLGSGLGRFKLKDLSALGKAMDTVRGGFAMLGTQIMPGLSKAMPAMERAMGGLADISTNLGPAIASWVGKLGSLGGALSDAAATSAKAFLGGGGEQGLIGNLLSFGNALKLVKIGMAVALAWEVGQYIGSIINQFLPQHWKDKIGEGMVKVGAFMHVPGMQELLDSNTKIRARGGSTPDDSDFDAGVPKTQIVQPGTAPTREIKTVVPEKAVSVYEAHHYIQIDGYQVATAVTRQYLLQGQQTASSGMSYDPTMLAYGPGMTGLA
jgi:hypothetical protein